MPRIFIVASAAAHALLVLWVEVSGVTTPHPVVVVDSWTGRGIEVDAVVTETALREVPVTAAPPVEAHEAHGATAPDQAEPAALAEVTESALAVTSTAHRAAIRPRPRALPPRPAHAVSPPRATASAAAAGEAGPTTSSPAAAPSSGGTFGAEGLPAGVRHLPKAFTRALGLASRGDPRWLALPVGAVGEARFRLSIDEEGRLGELEYDERTLAARPPPVVEHLLENTRLLLVAGRFSLDPTRVRAGAQRLRVRVEISDAGASDPTGDPNGLSELEYEPPVGARPGRGSFRLNSGRRVLGWVYVE